jgi:hypothetical protein
VAPMAAVTAVADTSKDSSLRDCGTPISTAILGTLIDGIFPKEPEYPGTEGGSYRCTRIWEISSQHASFSDRIMKGDLPQCSPTEAAAPPPHTSLPPQRTALPLHVLAIVSLLA